MHIVQLSPVQGAGVTCVPLGANGRKVPACPAVQKIAVGMAVGRDSIPPLRDLAQLSQRRAVTSSREGMAHAAFCFCSKGSKGAIVTESEQGGSAPCLTQGHSRISPLQQLALQRPQSFQRLSPSSLVNVCGGWGCSASWRQQPAPKKI